MTAQLDYSPHYGIDMDRAILRSSVRIMPEQKAWAGRVVAGTYARNTEEARKFLDQLGLDPAEAKAWKAGKPILLVKRGGRRR